MKQLSLKIAAVALTCLGVVLVNPACAVEDAHKGHDHAAEGKEKKGDHGHEGPKQDLGTTTIAGLKVTAIQIGKIEAGKEGIFEVELGKGAKEPKAVRLWVGVASGEGSTKTKAEKEGDGFDGHVEVPKTLPAGSELWVEIQPERGAKVKAAFALKN